uniref:Exonuclease n=1 Tax=Rhizobium phage IG49 TaxID=3129228 RepID=A0AAU8HYS4_9CAUD
MQTCIGIDIETTDTKKTAKILSIGAVVYEVCSSTYPFSVLDSFYINIEPKSYKPYGNKFTTSVSTMEFWLDNPEAFILLQKDRHNIREALEKLTNWYREMRDMYGGIDCVVGKPSHFDIAIIENAYEALGEESQIPWTHRQVRCLRTIYDTLNFDQNTVPFVGVQHNALDDATWQARGHYAAITNRQITKLE